MNHEVETPREHSWREVRQAVHPGTMTPSGRLRLGLRVLRSMCILAVLGGAVALTVYWYLWHGFDASPAQVAPVAKAEPLREVVVLTRGVLTQEWVTERLALPQGIALMAVDLASAKAALEREGQVRRAVVAREFPGTLVVTLEERAPVVRVMVPLDAGRPEQLLVSPDGTVYRGYFYDQTMIDRLPWLDGVRLSRRGEGVAPVEGIDRVTELLLASQHEAPHLARTWQVVSLAEWPRLVVRSAAVREIVFEPGAGSYRRQFAQLDFILDRYGDQIATRGPLGRVDVSLPSQAIVQLAATGATARSESSPVIFSQP